MDVIRMFQVIGRRWAVALPVIILGLATATWAAVAIPEQYTMESTMIVVAKDKATQAVTPAVLAEAAMAGQVQDEVSAATGKPAGYNVAVDAKEGILTVTHTAPRRDDAVNVTNNVLERLDGILKSRLESAGGGPEATVEIIGRASVNSVTQRNTGRRVSFEAKGSARIIGLAVQNPVKPNDAMRVLAIKLQSDELRSEVEAKGGSPVYEIAIPRAGTSMNVTINAASADRAMMTQQLLATLSTPTLATVLKDTFASTQSNLSVERIGGSEAPIKSNSGMLRSVVALVAVTIGLGLAVAFAAESFAEYRAAKKKGAAPAAGSPATSSVPMVPAARPAMPNSGVSRPQAPVRPNSPVRPARTSSPSKRVPQPATQSNATVASNGGSAPVRRPTGVRGKADLLPKPAKKDS